MLLQATAAVVAQRQLRHVDARLTLKITATCQEITTKQRETKSKPYFSCKAAINGTLRYCPSVSGWKMRYF